MATASGRLFHSGMVQENHINNRNFLQRFLKLKALHILKENIKCADTHNYTNQWYTSIQNIRKLTNMFIQSMAKKREEGLLPVLGPVEARACQRNRSWSGGDFWSASPMLGRAWNQHLADHS